MEDKLVKACKQMGGKLLLAAAMSGSFAGCATNPQNPPAAPECQTKATSITVTLAAAAIGHALDKKSGGGDGLTKFMGHTAENAVPTCPAPAALPASAPK